MGGGRRRRCCPARHTPPSLPSPWPRNAVFAAGGLNAASFDVLATLRRSGPPYALSPSALIDWTMVTSGTMTNRIDRLESAGLVSRSPDPSDGRASVVALTDEGFTLIDALIGEHVANQHRLMEGLDKRESAELDRLLAKWLACFEESSSA